MQQLIENFGKTVSAYCFWAEGEKHALQDARTFLLLLMTPIPLLEELRSEIVENEGVECWNCNASMQIQRGFVDLPFQYYREVFNPFDGKEEKPLVADLCDDLTSIYGDLQEGISLYKKGKAKQAAAMWVQGYFCHWGDHAASALRSIDCYYRAAADGERPSLF